jgi:transcription initiation factor TFIIIB Brf1 subunit/transcription initiation factor TFIIB
LSKDHEKELVKLISNLVSSVSFEKKEKIFREILKTKEKGIPISAFKSKLSGLEIIIKYLREIENKSFREISIILNRKLSTIYNTYNNSKIKSKNKLDTTNNSICIPYNIFSNRKYSVLESIVYYLKSKHNLSLFEISKLLNKNYSTIKTVYRRYNIKNVL